MMLLRILTKPVWPVIAALAAALSVPALTAPAVAVDFAIEGNSSISSEAIIESASAVACAGVDSVCIDAMCNAVADRYWESGYFDVRISCLEPGAGEDTVRISITEGMQASLKSVTVGGAAARDSAGLEAVFDQQVGRPFTGAGLEQGISELLRTYDGLGFPFTTVQPDLISTGEGWVSVGLRVDEGPRATIGDVGFKGLKGTRSGVLLRETGLVPGETYDGEKADDARAALMALGVFEDVSGPEMRFDITDTTISLTYEVVEARNSLFEGMVAYAPSAEANRLVGSLHLELKNIAGTLRRLRVLWNKPGEERLNWSVDYREPRILGWPVSGLFEVFSDVVETSFARRKIELGLAFTGERRLELGFGGFLGATKDRTLEGGEGDFNERGVSFAFRYEGRDRPVNPRSGLFVSLRNEVSQLSYQEESSLDRTLTGQDLDARYIADARFAVLAFRLLYKGVFASEEVVPQSHLARIGGMRSLRGYPEEWFFAEQALVGSLELRRVLGRHSRIYAFLDVATLEDESHDFGDLTAPPLGYGFGFMGGARTGLFRLEVALGREDTFSDARLHFALTQPF
ncbi:outer membrane protein assembly factor [Candidatus Eisenbacteria bacterium]|uniref:Outer membrane protein assembly factor n=1 Tax=Eiseniibacteriota bacterium TaxID=2212470 RepID=A0ABV6YNH6_UNCEI